MPRLGLIVGAVLADVMRARLAADELSRELAGEYRQDPILASMSVPRVVVDEATLTLHFSVADVDELKQAAEPDPRELRSAWRRHAVAELVPPEIAELGPVAVGKPSLSEVRRAIAGNHDGLVAATLEPLFETWRKLPGELRSQLGGKAAFRRQLERDTLETFRTFLVHWHDRDLIRAALRSRIEVAVRPDELPAEPELIQELRITARGDDMDVLLSEAQGLEKGR